MDSKIVLRSAFAMTKTMAGVLASCLLMNLPLNGVQAAGPACTDVFVGDVMSSPEGGLTTEKKPTGMASVRLPALIPANRPFKDWELPRCGTLLEPTIEGRPQTLRAVLAELQRRDGVYIYLIAQDGTIAISHRLPESAINSRGNEPYLATHRGLRELVQAESSDLDEVVFVAAGEIRVVGGQPVVISPRSGSFHDRILDVLDELSHMHPESREEITLVQDQLKALLGRRDVPNIETAVKILPEDPGGSSWLTKAQDIALQRTRERLDYAVVWLKRLGLVNDNTQIMTDPFAEGSHANNKKAAEFERRCLMDTWCLRQFRAMNGLVGTMIRKFGYKEGNTIVEKWQEHVIDEMDSDVDRKLKVIPYLAVIKEAVRFGAIDGLTMLYASIDYAVKAKAAKRELGSRGVDLTRPDSPLEGDSKALEPSEMVRVVLDLVESLQQYQQRQGTDSFN